MALTLKQVRAKWYSHGSIHALKATDAWTIEDAYLHGLWTAAQRALREFEAAENAVDDYLQERS